jgi:hypothetical protein
MTARYWTSGAYLVLATLIVATVTHGQDSGNVADLKYCAALSDLYVRYVGTSEFSPSSMDRTDLEGRLALSKCQAGDTATGIPILERKLRNARVTLPARS